MGDGGCCDPSLGRHDQAGDELSPGEDTYRLPTARDHRRYNYRGKEKGDVEHHVPCPGQQYQGLYLWQESFGYPADRKVKVQMTIADQVDHQYCRDRKIG